MPFSVLITAAAERDLVDIYSYIQQHDSLDNAAYVLSKLEDSVMGLSEMPERGVIPQELAALGIRDFREIFFKPYRIIYRVLDDKVYVLLVTDGRRDMQTLLQRRLLE
ncbi:MAG: plasmid stabilization protein [Desulfuromonas sp.]|nr:MAG: plasmid stabilization protein [Desulfuromonas sp.]